MLTITDLKAIDLAAYITRTAPGVGLKKSGAQYTGLCPFHAHKHNTPSFVVWPNTNTWKCFGACNAGGTIIDYVMRRDSLSVSAAIDQLQRELLGHITPAPIGPAPVRAEVRAEPPPAAWQARAFTRCCEWQDLLHAPAGSTAIRWLTDKRGLRPATLRTWRVGYNPADHYDKPAAWGMEREKDLWLPRGIVFPAVAAGEWLEVKFRRPVGDPKYLPVPRPNPAPALYGADFVPGRRVVVLCEGQPDALTIWQEAREVVGVATLGAQGYRLNPATYAHLFINAEVVLGIYDEDGKSENGVAAIGAVFGKRFERLRLPNGIKDPNDWHTRGGPVGKWLTDARWQALRRRWPDPADHLAHLYDILGNDDQPEALRADCERDAHRLQQEG